MKRRSKESRQNKNRSDKGREETRKTPAGFAVERPSTVEGSSAAQAPDPEVTFDYDTIHSEGFLEADVEGLRSLVRGAEGPLGSHSDFEFEQLGDSGFFSIASLPWEDRLTKSIRAISGWSVIDIPIKGETFVTPVFSDGVKNYRFDSWKIWVTFRRRPGVIVLDWSPETLEEDVKRAMDVRVPEGHEVREAAKCLLRNFSRDQLKGIWDLILKSESPEHKTD